MLLFSIIIPSYKRSDLLIEAVKSAINQDFTDYEIIVVDDGSEDKLIYSLIENGLSEKVKYFFQNNSGVSIARNHGATQALGKYLVFLDSDDMLLNNALTVYAKIIEKNPTKLILARRHSFIDNSAIPTLKNQNELIFKYFTNYLSKDRYFSPFGASNIIVEKEAFLSVGGFREKSKKTWHAEDWDLLMKLGLIQGFVFVENPFTVLYRIHSTNSINSKIQVLEGLFRVASTNREWKYPGGIMYFFNRYYIIGFPLFSHLKILIKDTKLKLALKIFIKVPDYIIIYFPLRIFMILKSLFFPKKTQKIVL